MSDLERRLAQMSPLQRAVLALKETQQRLEAVERQRDEPIAIVGMACRFPGGANNPSAFWNLLTSGTDAIREIPAERWNVDAFYDPDPTAPGKMNTRWGGFLDGIELFDNHFFSISDREATRLDPLHRMSLELTWEALEDAGLPPTSLRGSRTGVFIGLSHSEYGMKLSADPAQSDAYVSTGTAHCLAANRVSFLYDFHGPSVTLDTACSSSLVAVHMACQSLRLGESETAIAGGVNIILSPMATVNLTKAGFSAVDGRVRAFSSGATGYVRSEGAGLLVLKPLSAALRAGDSIYAVIRGSAVNQNGFSNGLTAPSRVAQEQVLRQAYASARVRPAQVQYVEAQGTGTHLGDAIEARALGEVLADGRPAGTSCAIGSVKTNLGHLEAASGAASLMKVALALHHGQVPPTLHYSAPNPDIPFESLPIHVQTSLEPWPGESPRVAGVSGFGFGGSNAHLVIGDLPSTSVAASPKQPTDSNTNSATNINLQSPTVTATEKRRCLQATAEGCQNHCPPRWLILSARTERALYAVVENYLSLLTQPQTADWADICYSAGVHRDHHDCRLAIHASHIADAAALLQAYLNGDKNELTRRSTFLHVGRKPASSDPKIALLFGDSRSPNISHPGRGTTPARVDSSVVPPAIAAANWEAAVKVVDACLSDLVTWSLSQVLHDEQFWQTSPARQAASIAYQIAVASWYRSLGVSPAINVGVGAGELAAAVSSGILSITHALRLALAFAERVTGEVQLAKPVPSGSTNAVPTITINPAQIPCISGFDSVNLASLTSAEAWLNRLDMIVTPDWHVVTTTIQRREISATIAIESNVRLLSAGERPTLTLLGVTHQDTTQPHLDTLGPLYSQGVNICWQQLATGAERYVRLPLYPWQKQRLWVESSYINEPVSRASDNVASKSESPVAVRAVQEQSRPRPDLNTAYEAPTTPLEVALAKSWAQILKLEQVGIRDNFFELGGDSLQGTILLNQLQEQLGEVVHVLVLFQFQTIHDLARHLRENYRTAVQRIFPQEPFADSSTADVKASTLITERDVEFSRRMTDSFAPNRVLAPITAPKNRRAVFVFSPPRSGTTLLRVMMAGHPQLFAPPELELLAFDTMRARQEAYEGVAGLWLEGLVRAVMETQRCDVETARAMVQQAEQGGHSTQQFYQLLQDPLGDRILVDKTPSYAGQLHVLQRAEEMFDEPLYVHLLRHPCGMIRSYVDYKMYLTYSTRYKVEMEFPYSPTQIGELVWLISHRNILQTLATVPAQRQHRICFESLVKQPDTTMQGLCEFLGLDYCADMAHPYEKREERMLDGVVANGRMQGDQKFLVKHKSIDPKVADEWREHLSIDILGEPTRRLAAELGYEEFASSPSSPQSSESDLPRLDPQQLLSQLDQLSDDEVTRLLQSQLAGEANHG